MPRFFNSEIIGSLFGLLWFISYYLIRQISEFFFHVWMLLTLLLLL